MQAGDLEQIVDPFVQTDEFQLAAALSRRRPDADEGADAHAVHWLTLARYKDRLALRYERTESAVTFVPRNAFSPRSHTYPQNRMRRLESVSGAATARLGCATVIVNGLRAAAAIFENQRPNEFPA
jgi:hypothetical protein